jgi:RNA polymerase sigma-70 factor (ECF subfamily)
MDSRDRPRWEQLVAAARDGNAEALGQLLESYRRYLKLLAKLQIDERFQAKVDPSDLVQETFVNAHRDFGTFRGTTEKELMGWLRQILAGNFADHVRRRYGRQRRDVRPERSLHRELDRSSHALDRGLVLTQTTPSQIAARRERVVVLADALEGLPDDYREVLILRHFKGLKFPELAGRMGRTTKSVEHLWARAVAELRRQIGEEPRASARVNSPRLPATISRTSHPPTRTGSRR